MSPLPTLAMRPLVSSRVLYVDLLVSTSTTTTTPSSEGMSVEMRTSWDSPQACATEAILSTTTLLMPLTMSSILLGALAGTPVKYARKGYDLGESERIGWSPFARRFAVHTLRGGHQRVVRLHAFDEKIAGTKLHAHRTGDSFLGRKKQRLDVAADGIQELAFVHQVAIGLRDRLLDALLTAGEHELLELPVGGEQHLGSGRLECNTPLRADDGIAEMNAAADAEGRRERLERLDERHGREAPAIEADRPALFELYYVRLGGTRTGKRVAREYPRVVRDAARGRERLLATDRYPPKATVDGI